MGTLDEKEATLACYGNVRRDAVVVFYRRI
jgi:hypothetical protein